MLKRIQHRRKELFCKHFKKNYRSNPNKTKKENTDQNITTELENTQEGTEPDFQKVHDETKSLSETSMLKTMCVLCEEDNEGKETSLYSKCCP